MVHTSQVVEVADHALHLGFAAAHHEVVLDQNAQHLVRVQALQLGNFLAGKRLLLLAFVFLAFLALALFTLSLLAFTLLVTLSFGELVSDMTLSFGLAFPSSFAAFSITLLIAFLLQ